MSKHKFPYAWRIADGYPAKGIQYHGCTAFGTFICGGGSSMGYKLAGFNHLGGVELDPKIATIYKHNHHPEFLFCEDIRDFNRRDDLPSELYNLDLLDGSPPCTTFSMSGKREKVWGKEKRFAEGQKMQRLDDLCFVYCDTILKLRPKTFVLENVSGLVRGNGKAYLAEILNMLSSYYNVQVFLLNGATMGVPQTRQRVFVVGLRKDYSLPMLQLLFNEDKVLFKEIRECNVDLRHKINGEKTQYLFAHKTKKDNSFSDIVLRLEGKKNSLFNLCLLHDNRVCNTIQTKKTALIPFEENYSRCLTNTELMKISTFPLDYDYSERDSILWFVAGMCVPPVMTAQISYQIYLQWLSKIK